MQKKSLLYRLSIALCSMTFALLMIGGTYTFAVFDPVEYVTIDINPGIEMLLNHFGRVITTRIYMQKEAALLGRLELEGMTLHEATDCIIHAAVELKYLSTALDKNDIALMVTAACETPERALELAERCTSWADDTLHERGIRAETMYASVTLPAMALAHSRGMSVGRLYLLDSFTQDTNDPADYTVRQLKDIPTRELLRLFHERQKQAEPKL